MYFCCTEVWLLQSRMLRDRLCCSPDYISRRDILYLQNFYSWQGELYWILFLDWSGVGSVTGGGRVSVLIAPGLQWTPLWLHYRAAQSQGQRNKFASSVEELVNLFSSSSQGCSTYLMLWAPSSLWVLLSYEKMYNFLMVRSKIRQIIDY